MRAVCAPSVEVAHLRHVIGVLGIHRVGGAELAREVALSLVGADKVDRNPPLIMASVT